MTNLLCKSRWCWLHLLWSHQREVQTHLKQLTFHRYTHFTDDWRCTDTKLWSPQIISTSHQRLNAHKKLHISYTRVGLGLFQIWPGSDCASMRLDQDQKNRALRRSNNILKIPQSVCSDEEPWSSSSSSSTSSRVTTKTCTHPSSCVSELTDTLSARY